MTQAATEQTKVLGSRERKQGKEKQKVDVFLCFWYTPRSHCVLRNDSLCAMRSHPEHHSILILTYSIKDFNLLFKNSFSFVLILTCGMYVCMQTCV